MDGVDVIKTDTGNGRSCLSLFCPHAVPSSIKLTLWMPAPTISDQAFGLGELLARIRVALRHSVSSRADTSSVFTTGALKVDLLKRQVFVDDREVHLTPISVPAIALLIKKCGKVLTHQTILKEVWGRPIRKFALSADLYEPAQAEAGNRPAQPQYLLTESVSLPA